MRIISSRVVVMLGVAVGGLAPHAIAQQAAATPAIRDVRPVTCPAYDAYPGIARYELKIFHGEDHVLPGRASERDEDAGRWFRRFDLP